MARTSTRPRQSSPLNLPGAFQLFKPSRDIVLDNVWIFGPIYAVPLFLYLHSWLWSPPLSLAGTNHWVARLDSSTSGWIFSPMANYIFTAFIGFSILWFLAAMAVGTVAQIMSQAAQLDAVEGKPLHFYPLWQTVKERWKPMLGLYVTIWLYVVVGTILFIVPGLIMLRRYYLAPYIMLETKCDVKQAMERSATMTKTYSGSIWGIIGVMFLIALISLVPYIGSLVAFTLGMLYSLAPALRFQQLKKLV